METKTALDLRVKSNLRAPSKLFGSPRRTELLILLALLEESYPLELARMLSAKRFSIQTMIDSLELEGVVATRLIGRTRRVSLNPRFYAYREIRDLLLKLADAEPWLKQVAATRRSRPRRRGKPL
jgi:DNA-binding MarR family transcriptional regulator